MTALTAADVAFVNRVCSRRFAGADPAPHDSGTVESAIATASAAGSAHARAATLVVELLTRGAFSTAPLQTALLVLHCALGIEGLSLLAPQGVVAGMIRQAASRGDSSALERWLEDRAVPSASDD